MENVGKSLETLQAIQWQLIEIIKQNGDTNNLDDPLILQLKTAVTALNNAKCIMGDRAIADGTLKITDSSDGSHLKSTNRE